MRRSVKGSGITRQPVTGRAELALPLYCSSLLFAFAGVRYASAYRDWRIRGWGTAARSDRSWTCKRSSTRWQLVKRHRAVRRKSTGWEPLQAHAWHLRRLAHVGWPHAAQRTRWPGVSVNGRHSTPGAHLSDGSSVKEASKGRARLSARRLSPSRSFAADGVPPCSCLPSVSPCLACMH